MKVIEYIDMLQALIDELEEYEQDDELIITTGADGLITYVIGNEQEYRDSLN